MSTALTPALRDQHEQDEAVIAKGIATFREVGEALQRIRDCRTYLQTHGNFEDYCRERWDLGRDYVDKTIAAAKTVAALPERLHTIVGNEATARAVAKVEPSVRVEVVERAVAHAKSEGRDKITARDVQEMSHANKGSSFRAESIAAGERAQSESEHLWGLKSLWKKTGKRDRAEFLNWAEQNQT